MNTRDPRRSAAQPRTAVKVFNPLPAALLVAGALLLSLSLALRVLA